MGWRPIETAPREGEVIIDLWANDRRYIECWWSGERWLSYQDGHYTDDRNPRLFVVERPSHWMPLPDDPNGSAQDGDA